MPIDILSLVKTLIDLGPVAIQYIGQLKRWGKGKEVEKYVRDLNDRVQKMKLLVTSLYAYRLLNLHITQVLDDMRVIPEKILYLKEREESARLCVTIKKDLLRTTNYFRQNLNDFPMEHLDHSHATMIRDLLIRIGQLLSTAEANLSNQNLDQFIENDLSSLIKEGSSLRGQTFFAIDKIMQEFSRM